MGTRRIALKFAYDGTGFSGFARQGSHRTVQGLLEDSLTALMHRPTVTVAAGRTDKGVHAEGQVIAFDAPGATDPEWVMTRLNKWLGPEIAVRAAAIVPDDFDARFWAKRRVYEYRLYVEPARDPFLDRFTVWQPERLNLAAMRAGAKALIGQHDFTSFCRAGQRSLTRRVRRIAIVERPKGRITMTVEADSFCHQMVRSIVGMLLLIGSGQQPASHAARALAAKDRHVAGPVAPARGLTLMRVDYRPDPFA